MTEGGMGEGVEGIEPTPEEARAIASLVRLARRWPKSLWLFADGHGLKVMRANEDGGQHHLGDRGGVDPGYILATVDIASDGGDW